MRLLIGSTVVIAATLAFTGCGGTRRAAPPGSLRLLAATTRTRDIAAERKSVATREAEQMLHEFVPPPGSRAIQVLPGHYRDAHVLHQSPGKVASEAVSLHRFWSVRMPLRAVIRFLRAHRLRGFRTTGAMWYTGKPHYLAMGSVGPAGRQFSVTPVGLPGRTVIRVDARVLWVYPRSRSEKVPTGVRIIDIHAPNHARDLRVTNSAKVARIAHWFNALPIYPPNVHIPCLAEGFVDIRVSFRNARGDLLARASLPPIAAGLCDPIAFSIHGRQQRPLTDGSPGRTFIGRLQSLLGVRLALKGNPR